MATLRPGRGTPKRKSPIINIIIIILIASLLGIFSWYAFFDDILGDTSGPTVWFLTRTEKETEPTEQIEPIQDPTESTAQPFTEPTTEAQTEQKEIVDFDPFWVDVNKLSDENYVNEIANGQNKQIAFWLKDKDGIVNLPYTWEDSPIDGLVNPNAQGNLDGLKTLMDKDFYVICGISALRDPVMARAYRSDAIQTGDGSLWLDRDNIPWIAPNSKTASNYINSLIELCEQIGANEVLVDNFSYPTIGKFQYIGQNHKVNSENITALSQTLQSNDIILSLNQSPFGESTTGQNIAQLKDCFQRIIEN